MKKKETDTTLFHLNYHPTTSHWKVEKQIKAKEENKLALSNSS